MANSWSLTKAILLLIMSLTLTACGGGSENGNDETITAKTQKSQPLSVFPTNSNYEWIYNGYSRTSFASPIAISGYEVTPLKHSTGAKEYFYTSGSTLDYFGVYIPQISVQTGSGSKNFTADVRFAQGQTMFSKNWNQPLRKQFSGTGEITINPTYGKREVTYKGELYYNGLVDVFVTAGNFKAHSITWRIDITTTIDGQTLTLPLNSELWLVEGVGIVKRVEFGYGYEEFDLSYFSHLPVAVNFESGLGAVNYPEPVKAEKVDASFSADVVYTNSENWLDVYQQDDSYFVKIKNNELPIGSYVATVVFSHQTKENITYVVTYTVSKPTLKMPDSLQIDLSNELTFANLSAQFELEEKGLITDITISPSASWLHLTKLSSEFGKTKYSLGLNYNNLQGRNGYHYENLQVSYKVAGELVTKQIYVTVILPYTGYPEMTDTYEATSGSSNPASIPVIVLGQTINTSNFDIQISYSTAQENWLGVVVDPETGALSLQLSTTQLVPGVYTATVTVVSKTGETFTYQVTYIIQAPSVTGPQHLVWSISGNTKEQELTQEFYLTQTGSRLSWEVSSDTSWLTVKKLHSSQEEGDIAVASINKEALKTLENGLYGAEILVVYDGDNLIPEADRFSIIVQLEIRFPEIKYPIPYVLYENEETLVSFNGTILDEIAQDALTVGNKTITEYVTQNTSEIRASISGLAPGNHEVKVKNALGLERKAAQLVVKPNLEYKDNDIQLPGRVESIVYDEEREAFFGVFWDEEYSHSNYFVAAKIYYKDEQWLVQKIGISGARAVTLTQDGKELLITADNCIVRHLDPDTLAILQTSSMQNCYYDELGLIVAFNNGQTIVADTNQWPTLYAYPGFQQLSAPSVHNPIAKTNAMRSHMTWAESPTISGPNELYVYSTKTNTFNQVAVNGEGYFLRNYLAFDADASRLMHGKSVYDENFNFIGMLDSDNSYLNVTQPTPNGKVALSYESGEIEFYDISSSQGPFKKLLDVQPIKLDANAYVSDMILPNDGSKVFIFATINNNDVKSFKLYVRDMPSISIK